LADTTRDESLRAAVGQAKLLIGDIESEKPNYQVFRFNEPAVEVAGERYGLIKLKLPAAPVRPAILVFSDTGNIAEYDLLPVKDGGAVRENLRVIYPRLASYDFEEAAEKPARFLSLPHPWDLLELHILGFPPALLRPDEEYVFWFRFGDRRPTDIVMTLRFLPVSVDLKLEELPGHAGLPEL
jgi:hypothetical protein